MLAFVISGVLGSLAGLVYTARQGSLTPQFGTAFLLPVFAACFLGSVTLTRRKFHILGTVLGVYLIETGTNGLLILGAPAYTQQLFAGAVLILATVGARYRTVGFRAPSRPLADAGKAENSAFAQAASERRVGLGDGRDG
jgi:ribose transport system permease protein